MTPPSPALGSVTPRSLVALRAPTALGLAPPQPGVEPGAGRAPDVLMANGLVERIGARDAGEVLPLPYRFGRDPETGVRNAQAVRDYAERLGAAVSEAAERAFVVLLGGDCSVLLGAMWGLRQRGEYGLVFVDGHRDFQTPETSATGGAAGMDLALVTGRGPEVWTRFRDGTPLVRDEAVVALAYRDEEPGEADGSREIVGTSIRQFSLDSMRQMGVGAAAERALSVVGACPDGFWVHLDVDVLTTEAMPAVDSPQPGGLTTDELEALLVPLLRHPGAAGLEVTIYDPDRDPDGRSGRTLTSVLARVLAADP